MGVRTRRGSSLAAAIVATLGACTRHEPPAPSVSPSVARPEFVPASTAETATATASTDVVNAATSAPATGQTRDVPPPSGRALEERAASLWSAIVDDDPERAMPFFFPLAAYVQVKDVADPSADWKRRLVAAYGRDIHVLHARLTELAPATAAATRDDRARPHFVSLDVPQDHARWVEPGEEYNKVGYYRVFGSKLRYEVGGAAHTFDLRSLISWRGEWYVVHLSAVK
jgi:hypothetical protein